MLLNEERKVDRRMYKGQYPCPSGILLQFTRSPFGAELTEAEYPIRLHTTLSAPTDEKNCSANPMAKNNSCA